jgi:hypothetical protein
MATRANKITIRVIPSRRQETISFRASGRFGKTSLTIAPQYHQGVTLSPTTDEKAYWNDVLVKVQAYVLSL